MRLPVYVQPSYFTWDSAWSFQFEDAAKEVADEVTRPRPEGEEKVHDIQIMLNSNANCSIVRDLKVGIL